VVHRTGSQEEGESKEGKEGYEEEVNVGPTVICGAA